MKLRKIEILGFKSFRAKTGIEIGDGITGVVGPNGCGKSNIVDGIRWAMGSQSPRDLRGRAMEDVIFNGSENHRPMGFAEVSLTFDNDPQTSLLPLEWRDVHSVRVTRRLFRSGDSEYEINGTRARLRDIHDIFAGTGVSSRDAYSIIEQGRIGFIVASKPEERRVIIEEAAGITRYRNQRKLAEKRLERTQENLLRVSDVLREIARQVVSLERQAAKAARARELNEELRDAEMVVHAQQVRTSRAAHQEALRNLTLVEEKTQGVQLELARVETVYEASKLLLSEREQALNEASEAAFSARSRVDLLRANLAHREREQAQLIARQEEAQARLVDDRAALDALEAEASGMQTQHLNDDDVREALTDEVESLQFDVSEVRETIQAHRARQEAARAELNECERVIARASTRADSIRADLRTLTARDEEGSALVEDFAERALDARERVRELDEALEEAEEQYLDVSEAIETLRSQEREARERVDQARVAARESADALRDARAALESVAQLLLTGAGVAEGTREILKIARDRGLPGVLGPIATRFRLAPDRVSAFGAVLGDLADAILVDRRENIPALLAIARDAGRSLVLVTLENAVEGDICEGVEAIAPVPERIVEALRTTRRVEAIDAHASVAQVDAQRMLSLGDGVFVYRAGAMAAEQLLRVQREQALLEERLVGLMDADDAAAHAVRTGEQRLNEVSAARAEAEERVAVAEDRRRRVRLKREEAREGAQHLERQLRRAQEELADFRQRRAALEADLRTSREEVERAQGARGGLVENVSAIQSQVTQLESRREQLDERLSELRVRLARMDAELRAAEATRARIAREIEATHARIAAWQKTLANADAEREALQFALTREGEELEIWQRKSVDAEVHAAQAKKLYEDESVGLRELELMLADTRRLAAASLRDREGLVLALERARSEEQQAEAQCVERFRLSVAELLHQVGSERPDERLTRHLVELRERIERLGAVNPAAEEEYQGALERQRFLQEQSDDLESALKELERAIRRMDRTCRELFATTFEQVNEGFQRMFPRLFRGGRAHLELTNPDDLLATGIEIVAQPPGKKLQSIQLMSGGEKALTATALIFAIFELKPSPICILDEVDAPLDEANVGRFADMVREISSRSQFLIITHNTRTMEASDTLYGVTMEEPGVSKLVGVQLRELTTG